MASDKRNAIAMARCTLQDWYNARLEQGADMHEAYVSARQDWLDIAGVEYTVRLPAIDEL